MKAEAIERAVCIGMAKAIRAWMKRVETKDHMTQKEARAVLVKLRTIKREKHI